jgi:hypothetical protein
MKKLYMKTFLVLLLGIIGISTYAQGLWLADSIDIISIRGSLEIPFEINNLSCMHSDTALAASRAEPEATDVEYNGVLYDNKATFKSSTNNMYYAFRPAKDGTLDISLKYYGGKLFFLLELTDACPDNADLAALTTNIIKGDEITGTPEYFTTPTVYDTDGETEKTWNGTVAPVTVNTFMVFSWEVEADKTYIAGAIGSKLTLRGINYICEADPDGLDNLTTVQSLNFFPNPATGNVIVKMDESTTIGIYNSVGLLLKQQLVTSSNNNVDISALEPGMYFIRDMNSKNQVQKLIIK